jgi:hypothetical protein
MRHDVGRLLHHLAVAPDAIARQVGADVEVDAERGMRGSPTSDMPMIGHGFGLSWQNRWNEPPSFSGRIARLPWTKPLATPAVVCHAAAAGVPGRRRTAINPAVSWLGPSAPRKAGHR